MKRRHTFWTIILIVIAFVLGIVSARLFSYGNKPKSDPQQQNSAEIQQMLQAKPKQPKYTSEDALNLVLSELDQGKIKITMLGLESGYGVRGKDGGLSLNGMTGLPLFKPGYCPNDTLGVTVGLPRVTGGKPYMREMENIDLGYCVNQYSGEIYAENDAAHELKVKADYTAWGKIEAMPIVNSRAGP
jgi:hypothetical protein